LIDWLIVFSLIGWPKISKDQDTEQVKI